ncbi:MAG: 50S ribosomal protein L25 [Desulfobacteraceae bacterium]|nr:50S ribosomal protein L25 [Desulfobacteraceae bacterium]
MLQFEVSASVRRNFGKGAARGLRRDGKTPAVLYGPKTEPISLVIDTKDMTKVLLTIQRRNAVLSLDIEGGSGKRHVVVQELQSDPINDTLIHADFYEISLDAPMVLEVPLQYKGKARGVEMGGDFVISRHSITLKGKVLDIPDSVEVDVSELDPGAALTCGQLPIPAKVSLVGDAEAVCASVTAVGG